MLGGGIEEIAVKWQCVTDDKGNLASYNKYMNDQIEAFHMSVDKKEGAEIELGKINNNTYKIVFLGMVNDAHDR